MFTKILAVFLLLSGTAEAAYFPTFSVNNFNQLGVYNSTPPTITDGANAQLQLDVNGKLRVVDASNVTNWATLLTEIGEINTDIPIGLTVTSNRLLVDGSGVTQPISAVALPLPTGAATEAKQDVANASLSSIDTKLTSPIAISAASLPLPAGASTAAKQPALGTAGAPSADIISVQGIASMTPLKVDGSGATQPVSVASLPLPAGASTSANQTTGNSSLSSIDGKLGSLGQKAMTGSAPVVIASDQSAIPATQSGTWTVSQTAVSGISSTGGSSATQQTFTAPGATKYAFVQADPANTDNIRWGSVSTSATVGMILAPGQDTGVFAFGPSASIFTFPVTGTQKVNITWLF